MSPLFIIKASPIHGTGLFAACDIDKGTVITRWHPREISAQAFEALSPEQKNYVERKGGKYLQLQPPECYINHSCEPNTVAVNSCDVACRDIAAGEELTTDYSATGSLPTPFTCHCGSPSCRGIIK
jgi:hypothetical protein